MSVTDPLDDELLALGETFAVQVVAAGPIAQRALGSIRAGLEADFGARSSPTVTLPEGVMVRFDGVGVDPRGRDTVSDLLRNVLDEVGLDGDHLVLHPTDGMQDLDDCPRAVVLRMFPPPGERGGPLPPALIDIAGDWVFGDMKADALVRMRVLGVELAIPVADAAGVLHGCAAGGAWCDLVTGAVDDRVRTASISFGTAPHVAIGAGGPGADDDGLLARFDLLAHVIGDISDWCAYACADFEEAFDQLGLGLATSAWTSAGNAPANRVVGEAGDRAVPDAYPIQLLGPGHIARLEEAGARFESFEAIGDHAVVRIGDPATWLTDSPSRDSARRSGWRTLAPLLLDADDLGSPAASPRHDGPADERGVPDLDHIIIEPGPHPRRGTRLTPLELAAWLAGEHHSDEPDAVGPVLSALLRGMTEGLAPEHRPRIGHLVPLALASSVDDEERVCDVVDWLVRVQAATWLNRAGVVGLAERLADVADPSSATGSRRTVALLCDALVTAQRRLDITTAIAGEHSEVVEACAWDAWENAAQACGWTAASDAVTVGAPGELAAEIELRLVESSRARASGDDADGANTAWAAAYAELGSFAWRRAWDKADRYIRDESGFSVGQVIGAHLADAEADAVFDAVDRAASDALTQAIIAADGRDPLDVARSAATGPAGDAWRDAVASAAHVIGESLFDHGMDQARDELVVWFDRGPTLVGYLTVTALAREAAGVGARAIAARAAAERAAEGASAEECEQAAAESLAESVDELAESLLDLAAQLCEPGEVSASIA